MTQLGKYKDTLNNVKVVEINEVDCLVKDGVTIAKVGDKFVDINRNVLRLKSVDLHFMTFTNSMSNTWNPKIQQYQTVHFLENELGLRDFNSLKELVLENSSFSEEVQEVENGNTFLDCQVVVWCQSFGKSWSICFQNGDMNGDGKGIAVWTNDGANSGIDEFRDILIDRAEFQCLIDETTYWKYEALNEFINDFISDYANETNPEKHFASDEVDDREDIGDNEDNDD